MVQSSLTGSLRAHPVAAAAAAHSKTPAQVLLRWGLQHHGTIVPKSTKPERIKENIDIFSFELTGAASNTCNPRSLGEIGRELSN